MSMIEQKQKNGASILVVVIALILVVICGGSIYEPCAIATTLTFAQPPARSF